MNEPGLAPELLAELRADAARCAAAAPPLTDRQREILAVLLAPSPLTRATAA